MDSPKLPVTAAPMPLYPTLDSLQDVVTLADSKLPISNKNDLFSILFTYHNTLLKLIKRS
jgi:hypothetical protein